MAGLLNNLLNNYGSQLQGLLNSKDGNELFQKGGALLGDVTRYYAKYRTLLLAGSLVYYGAIAVLILLFVKYLMSNPDTRRELKQAGREITSSLNQNVNTAGGGRSALASTPGGSESENDYSFNEDGEGRGFGGKTTTARRQPRGLANVPENSQQR